MIRKILIIFFIGILFSCDDKSATEEEIEKIPIEFQVVRFDQEFAQVTPEDLPDLKAKYPYLFPERFPDSIWIERIQDSIQQELNTEVTSAFRDFSAEEDGLYGLFQHIKYYFPPFEAPTVVTITSEVDYRNKVLVSPDYLFISLDTYLGTQHKFYLGIQQYLKKNFNRDQILPDVAAEYAEVHVPTPQSNTFLDHMLYYGKIHYLKDLWLPDVPDHIRLGYTQAEVEWVRENEQYIWRYFIERELLFDTDSDLQTRFLFPGPFSKFYLELDNESPAMVGQFIGWKIIEEYMEKNDVSLEQMLETDAATIFNTAKYKPNK